MCLNQLIIESGGHKAQKALRFCLYYNMERGIFPPPEYTSEKLRHIAADILHRIKEGMVNT